MTQRSVAAALLGFGIASLAYGVEIPVHCQRVRNLSCIPGPWDYGPANLGLAPPVTAVTLRGLVLNTNEVTPPVPADQANTPAPAEPANTPAPANQANTTTTPELIKAPAPAAKAPACVPGAKAPTPAPAAKAPTPAAKAPTTASAIPAIIPAPNLKMYYFQLGQKTLQNNQCSLTRVVVMVDEFGNVVLSARADQNPVLIGDPSEPKLKPLAAAMAQLQTSHLKRNEFWVKLRFLNVKVAPVTQVGPPVLAEICFAPFMVQRGEPRWLNLEQKLKLPPEAIPLIDRVEIQFTYR